MGDYVKVRKTSEVFVIISIMTMLSGFSSSMLTHQDARKYQESVNQGTNYDFENNGKIIFTNQFNGSENWNLIDRLNKSSTPHPGIIEIDRHHRVSNKSQVDKAWKLYSRTYDNAKERGWFNYSKGSTEGFLNSSISESHYPNEKYLYDGEILNPEKPEYLMYYKDPNSGKQKLLGVMFMTNKINDTGPQIGGSLTKWHYHYSAIEQCYKNNVLNIGVNETCKGTNSKISPEMIHVWFIERDEGIFSTNMTADPANYPEIPEKMSKKEFKNRIWKSYPTETLQCKP